MRIKSVQYALATLAFIALTLPAFAKPVTKNVAITITTRVAGKVLNSGDDYTFRVDETKVTVEKDRKVIAEATGRWQESKVRWEADSYVRDADGQLMEIRFRGEKRSFIITGQ